MNYSITIFDPVHISILHSCNWWDIFIIDGWIIVYTILNSISIRVIGPSICILLRRSFSLSVANENMNNKRSNYLFSNSEDSLVSIWSFTVISCRKFYSLTPSISATYKSFEKPHYLDQYNSLCI